MKFFQQKKNTTIQEQQKVANPIQQKKNPFINTDKPKAENPFLKSQQPTQMQKNPVQMEEKEKKGFYFDAGMGGVKAGYQGDNFNIGAGLDLQSMMKLGLNGMMAFKNKNLRGITKGVNPEFNIGYNGYEASMDKHGRGSIGRDNVSTDFNKKGKFGKTNIDVQSVLQDRLAEFGSEKGAKLPNTPMLDPQMLQQYLKMSNMNIPNMKMQNFSMVNNNEEDENPKQKMQRLYMTYQMIQQAQQQQLMQAQYREYLKGAIEERKI